MPMSMDQLMANLRRHGGRYLYTPGSRPQPPGQPPPNQPPGGSGSGWRPPTNPWQPPARTPRAPVPYSGPMGGRQTGGVPGGNATPPSGARWQPRPAHTPTPPPPPPPLPQPIAGGLTIPGFTMPGRVDPSGVREANQALADPINIRTGSAVQVPDAPGYAGLGPAPERGGIDELVGRAAGGVELSPLERARLGAAGEPNRYEQLALEGFEEGFDPGTGQFTGTELPEEIYSEAQINQLAQQRAAPTVRAFQDAQRYAAEAGSRGGYVDAGRINALRARGAIEGAGALSSATRDAQLEGAVLNAEQAARAAGNRRANYETDLGARLGLGRLGLESAGTAGAFGLQQRGLDQQRDLAELGAGVTQRGQDLTQQVAGANLSAGLLGQALSGSLAARGQDIGYGTEAGRQGLAARGQNLDYNLGAGSLGVTQRGQDLQGQIAGGQINTQRDLARASNALGEYQAGIGENLGLGRLGADVRGQDIQAGLAGRGQDIEQNLGLGRLGQAGYQTQADLYNAEQQRFSRMDELERELESGQLTQDRRAELERERMTLEREMEQARLAQRSGEFGQMFGLDQRRLGLSERELAQRGDQFGRGLEFEREQADLGRGFAREQSAVGRQYGREQQLMDWMQDYSDPEQFAQVLQRGLRNQLPRILQRYGLHGLN